MPEAVILDAVRTPVGKFRGALSRVRPDDLAAEVLRALVKRTGLDPADVDEVVLGCANQAGEDNRNVARMSLLLAGFPYSVPGITVNRLCSSGLDAIIQAGRAIATGDARVAIAGGVASMTRAPFVLAKSESPFDRKAEIYDTTIGWRFPNSRMTEMFPLESMGETAENVDAIHHIPRERQDAFAYRSHCRAVAAINSGRFRNEIVPIEVREPGEPPKTVDTDEHPRMQLADGQYRLATSLEGLAKLKPAFREGGTVTAGNSSGINDGAAAVLLSSPEAALRLGLRPAARIVSSASAGVDPRTMGLGPVPAVRKALDRAHLRVEDLDLIELNEAFAVQVLAVMDELGLPEDRTNVNGGAIALGHPLGCSGARLVTTLLHEMKRRREEGVATSRYGLVTMCVGMGQGVAAVLEVV
ncbi:MAG: acetyl-CoA C-acyltransferase [Acidobacteria bacterium]|nr:MAG: acetyl-CoA C-acyltransferase [Acidobacteriota bacterium]